MPRAIYWLIILFAVAIFVYFYRRERRSGLSELEARFSRQGLYDRAHLRPMYFIACFLPLSFWIVQHYFKMNFLGLLTLLAACLSSYFYFVIRPRMIRRFKSRIELANYLVCPKCLYSLQGLPDSGACPECGEPHDQESLHQTWHRLLATARKDHSPDNTGPP